MTTPDPNTPTGTPPPVPQPHPETATSQRPPVIVQNADHGDLLRTMHSTLTDIGNKLGGLPESVVHSFREATGTPPATPPTTPPATTPPATTPPTVTPPAGKAKAPNAWHKFWFGDLS